MRYGVVVRDAVVSTRAGARTTGSSGAGALVVPRSVPLSATVWDGRRNNFDAIRLALAVLVIYSHSYPLGTGSEISEPMARLSHGQVTLGGVAVDLFFVMSGFLIAGSAERSRTLADFIKKRVARIYPAFLAAAIFSLSIVVPLASVRFAESTAAGVVWNFVSNTLRLREFSFVHAFATNPYPNAINGSLWSVAYEFWCYVGVALLAGLGWLKRPAMVVGLFAASWLLSVLSIVRNWSFGGKVLGLIFGSPQLWARLLPLYLAGVVFYLLRNAIPFRGWLVALSTALLLGSCFAPRAGWAVVFPFAGTYLVFVLAFNPAVRLHSFGHFGDFSYGTYLYAFPVQQVIVHYVGRSMPPALLFAAAAPLTLLIAVGSWYGVERHFLQPRRRRETVLHAVESAA